jgi:hypothetical protein
VPSGDGRVVIAHPVGESVSSLFMVSLVGLLTHDAQNSRRIVDGGGYMANPSGVNITNARNEIVRTFLDDHDAEWLWWIDTDHTFTPDILERLIATAGDGHLMVGALAFRWSKLTRSASPTLYGFKDDKIVQFMDYPTDKVVPAITGTGCLLTHRSVYEAMGEKYQAPYQWFREEAFHGQPVGEDITFALRALALGFEQVVDTSIVVGHDKGIIVDDEYFRGAQNIAAMLKPAPTPNRAERRKKAKRRNVEQMTAAPDELREVVRG